MTVATAMNLLMMRMYLFIEKQMVDALAPETMQLKLQEEIL